MDHSREIARILMAQQGEDERREDRIYEEFMDPNFISGAFYSLRREFKKKHNYRVQE